MLHKLHCSCGEVIVKSDTNQTKICGKVVLFKSNKAYTVCKTCNNEQEIPVSLDLNLMKSMVDTTKIPLYVRKR